MTKEIVFWDGWLQDNSRAPHEAISAASAGAEQMLAALQKLRPDSLKQVAQEIDAQVGRALHEYIRSASIDDADQPGVIRITLADCEEVARLVHVVDMARDIASRKQDDFADDFNLDASKEAWAQKLEEAAAIIRAGMGA